MRENGDRTRMFRPWQGEAVRAGFLRGFNLNSLTAATASARTDVARFMASSAAMPMDLMKAVATGHPNLS